MTEIKVERVAKPNRIITINSLENDCLISCLYTVLKDDSKACIHHIIQDLINKLEKEETTCQEEH